MIVAYRKVNLRQTQDRKKRQNYVVKLNRNVLVK
jgi:hypothetical protein